MQNAITVLTNLSLTLQTMQSLDDQMTFLQGMMQSVEQKRYISYASNYKFIDTKVLDAFVHLLNTHLIQAPSSNISMDLVKRATFIYDNTPQAIFEMFPCISSLLSLIQGATKAPWTTIPFRFYVPKQINEVIHTRGLHIAGSQYAKIIEDLRATSCWPADDMAIEQSVIRTGGTTVIASQVTRGPVPRTEVNKAPASSIKMLQRTNRVEQVNRNLPMQVSKLVSRDHMVSNNTSLYARNNHSLTQRLNDEVNNTKQALIVFKEDLIKIICFNLRFNPPPHVEDTVDDEMDDLIELILVFLIKTTPTEILLAQLQQAQYFSGSL